MSLISQFTMTDMYEAGVHYGHKTMKWNPEMFPYIYGVKNGIHIIDLKKTYFMLRLALKFIYDLCSNNGRILFVCTRKNVNFLTEQYANEAGQYYINNRWLGGTLTNAKTVASSIDTLTELEDKINNNSAHLKKKELLSLNRQREKLLRNLGGIRGMAGKPDAIVVIGTDKESIAIREASRVGVPVVSVVDTNSNLKYINYPIPGNDDAISSVQFFLKLFSEACLAGIQKSVSQSDEDIGKSVNIEKLK